MEGLAITVFRLSCLENLLTFGSEYYLPEYVSRQTAVRSAGKRVWKLNEISEIITDGDHGSADYQDDGVPFILSENVKAGWIDTSDVRYISREHHDKLPRSKLRPGDVVVTKTGVYFGNSAVIPAAFGEANTIAHVGKITLKKGFDPYYVSTFLNSLYGYSQLRRRGIKATRPEIKLVEFDDIEIIFVAEVLQRRVRATIEKAHAALHATATFHEQAEEALLTALGLGDWTPPEPLAYSVTLSALKAAERWDSQFHRPVVDDLRDKLKNRFCLEDLSGRVLKGRSVAYDEDGDIPIIRSGDLVDIDDNDRFLRAPSTEPITYLRPGDVLISSIGFGSIGKVHVFDKPGRYGTVSEVTIVRQDSLNPYYLAAFLRSRAGQYQIDRFITGATGQLHLYPRDVAKIFVPVLSADKQQEFQVITEQVRRERARASELLERAKRAVEIAIEDGEAAALAFLDDVGGEAMPGAAPRKITPEPVA